ncbi:hypothetical protein [Methylobacterium sp. 37f]|uniref:hypothetical protein n=1 Tax=Methylobacterium sp. 37f TaxID=2817058 RepID=UPI001FFD7FD6|nr:hypothetical protein [Methylobacterium sp. 37f]MCK2055278.1 hypothetical protein [Methylobacterium sp. 37f]
MIIHESEYGDGPGNFDVEVYGDVLNVNLTYPNITIDGCRHVHVNQESVRASDGIRLSYDYDRDGWSIQQQVCVDLGDRIYTPNPDEWVEVSFVQSWSLMRDQREGDFQ